MHPYRGIPIVSEADFVQLMLKDLAPSVAAKNWSYYVFNSFLDNKYAG